jgi:hypothetical protein
MVQGFKITTVTAMVGVASLLTLAAFSVSGPSGIGVGNAQAYSSAPIYCLGGYIVAGGRCVDGRRVRHRTVVFDPHMVYGTTGSYCAGAKTQPDGSGGNSMPFACAPPSAQFARSGPYADGQTGLGYATLINNTGDLIVTGADYMEWYP